MFALDTPAVTGQGAIGTHHPMAGNGDRQRVGGTGLRHRPRGLWSADALGNLGVAGRGAWGNLPKRLPDALLEGRAAHIERQLKTQARCFRETDYLGHDLLEIGVTAVQRGSFCVAVAASAASSAVGGEVLAVMFMALSKMAQSGMRLL